MSYISIGFVIAARQRGRRASGDRGHVAPTCSPGSSGSPTRLGLAPFLVQTSNSSPRPRTRPRARRQISSARCWALRALAAADSRYAAVKRAYPRRHHHRHHRHHRRRIYRPSPVAVRASLAPRSHLQAVCPRQSRPPRPPLGLPSLFFAAPPPVPPFAPCHVTLAVTSSAPLPAAAPRAVRFALW